MGTQTPLAGDELAAHVVDQAAMLAEQEQNRGAAYDLRPGGPPLPAMASVAEDAAALSGTVVGPSGQTYDATNNVAYMS